MSYLADSLVMLAVAGVVFWWLSGFDADSFGSSSPRVWMRRMLRCGFSLGLLGLACWLRWEYKVHGQPMAGYLFVPVTMPLALIWCGCLSQLGGNLFNAMVDPDDDRSFHPRSEIKKLDLLGRLVREGKKSQAIRLCHELKKEGEVSAAALDLVLSRLGVETGAAPTAKPLAQAHRLQLQGDFTGARDLFKTMLAADARNLEAAMGLMRLYARDLHQPENARALLRTLEKKGQTPRDHLDFARRSMEDWIHPKPKEPAAQPPSGSVEELLANGFIGTAVETLEEKVEADPGNFQLVLRLAEVHAVYASNPAAAERIVKQMEGRFTPEQCREAAQRLRACQLKTLKPL